MNQALYDDRVPSFSATLTGHMISGAIKAVFVALMLFATSATGAISEITLSHALTFAFVAMILVETVSAVMFHVVALRRRHPRPGSTAVTVVDLALPPLAALLFGTILLDGGIVIAAAICFTIVFWVFTLLVEKPWREDDAAVEAMEKSRW